MTATGKATYEPRFSPSRPWHGYYLVSPKYSFMTEKQQYVYEVIETYWLKRGYAPSIQNIMVITGDKSKANIQRIIVRLCELGHCKRIPRTARSVRPAYIKLKRPNESDRAS